MKTSTAVLQLIDVTQKWAAVTIILALGVASLISHQSPSMKNFMSKVWYPRLSWFRAYLFDIIHVAGMFDISIWTISCKQYCVLIAHQSLASVFVCRVLRWIYNVLEKTLNYIIIGQRVKYTCHFTTLTTTGVASIMSTQLIISMYFI